MSEDQKRIKLLEILGWTDLKRVGAAMRGTSPKGQKNAFAPNPFKNLNMISSIEDKMFEAYDTLEGAETLSYYTKLLCGFKHPLFTKSYERAECLGAALKLW